MHLTQGEVKTKLIEVLQSIQSDSGYKDSQITGATRPLRDLKGFDSMIWPCSIGELSASLGINIPNDRNIYLSKDCKPLTVDEAAAVVCEIVGSRGG